ncbi:uncharacterized protein CBL_10097 [Carabus blaptoides fortunei]
MSNDMYAKIQNKIDRGIFDSTWKSLEEAYMEEILAYPCRRYLLTPIRASHNQAEVRYNRAHIRTRNVVERCFGVWKGRFPGLTCDLRTKLSTTLKITVATAVLHNIAKTADANTEEEFVNEEIDMPAPEVDATFTVETRGQYPAIELTPTSPDAQVNWWEDENGDWERNAQLLQRSPAQPEPQDGWWDDDSGDASVPHRNRQIFNGYDDVHRDFKLPGFSNRNDGHDRLLCDQFINLDAERIKFVVFVQLFLAAGGRYSTLGRRFLRRCTVKIRLGTGSSSTRICEETTYAV